MKKSVRVIFNPMNKVVEVEQGTLLLDAVRKANILMRSICGGHGECGTCKVILNKGEAADVSSKFKRWLSPEEVAEGYHLACLTQVLGDCEVTIPVESRVFSPKILLEVETIVDKINPAAKKYLAEWALATATRKPTVRLKGYTGQNLTVNGKILKKLIGLKKAKAVTATVSWTGKQPEIIDVELGDRTHKSYGLAVDLGTTTVVAFLVDLTDGKILCKMSELNSQITYGEALVSRISYGSNAKGLKKLQESAVQSINDLAEKISSSLDVKPKEMMEVCVGGNTVMNHLLAGLNPSYLAYVDGNSKVSRKPIIRKARQIGIRVNPEAHVYCLPNVSRFLGGDAVGDVLTCGMYESGELSLLVDMGTNGEIIFGSNTWLMSASCASGPAFEGGGIKFGMRAMRGGIEHVKISPLTCKAEYSVIGGSEPIGICGSGIIDAAAEMFAAGILDFTGKLVRDRTDLVRQGRDGLEYVVVPAEETDVGRDIVITQRDMDYLMDSKAATCGAIIVLMRKLKVSIDDVKNVFLAGAFGTYADLKNVTRFGIFPEFPKAKTWPIGNGSIAGAYASLLSLEKRKMAEEIAQKMFYVDLLVDPIFSEAYSESLYIPGSKEYFPTLGT
jgi:uncharacterized 2Fe-2S/4Fe-4S cluster protein (DUF4445 family)